MLACIFFGLTAFYVSYFIALDSAEIGRRLLAYLTALAITAAVAVVLKMGRKGAI